MSREDRSVYRKSMTMRMNARYRAYKTLASRYPEEYYEEYKKECAIDGLSVGSPKRVKSSPNARTLNAELELIKTWANNRFNTPEGKLFLIQEYISNKEKGIELQTCGHPINYKH